MGKRSKDIVMTSRRRPMIQLGSSKKSVNTPPRNISHAALEDSMNISAEGDQLAGFLAEINAMDASSGANDKLPSNSSATFNVEPSLLLYDPSNFDPATQGHLLPRPWEACYDEGTGYYYYWNTETNVVQWYPPIATLPPPPPAAEERHEAPEFSEQPAHGEDLSEPVVSGHEQTTSTACPALGTSGEPNNDSKEGSEDAGIIESTLSVEPEKDDVKSEGPEVLEGNSGLVSGYESSSDDNEDANSKDKDILLQLKEKIRRKKEQKLKQLEEQRKKEQEEEERREMEEREELERQQREREEALREKLIRRKAEREEAERRLRMEQEAKLLEGDGCKDIGNDDEESNDDNEESAVDYERSAVDNEESIVDEELDNVDDQKGAVGMLEKEMNEMERKALEFSLDIFAMDDEADTVRRAGSQKRRAKEKLESTQEKAQVWGNRSSIMKDTPDIGVPKSAAKGIEPEEVSRYEDSELRSAAGHNLDAENRPPLAPKDSIKNVKQRVDKSTWRIVDAVYDDDDDEDDDDNQGNSGNDRIGGDYCDVSEDEKVGNGCQSEQVDVMDDYVEMLLEGGIDKVERKLSPPPPPEVDTKKKSRPPEPPPLPHAPHSQTPPLPPGKPPQPAPPAEDFMKPPLPVEDEPLAPPKFRAVEELVYQAKINAISSELAEKLEFLGITKKGLDALQILLIELETRMQDWLAGVLDGGYLVGKLEEFDRQLKHYEETSVPEGWLCHWSSDFKMYYYHNSLSGESQWEYPQAVPPPPAFFEKTGGSLSPRGHTYAGFPDQSVHRTSSSNSLPGTALSYSTEDAPTLKSGNHPARNMAVIDVQSCPPVLTSALPVSAAVVTDPYRDPYRASKRKKTAELNPPLPDARAGEILLSNGRGAALAGTLSPLVDASVIAAAPVIHARQPDSGSSSPFPPNDASDVDSDPGSFGQVPLREPSASRSALLKTKRKKASSAAALPSKKLKHVSTLVQKWQSVKQRAVEEEKIDEESEDEDFETHSERKIQEWKKEVQLSGEAEYNPNFEEIKGDWRERLKKKST